MEKLCEELKNIDDKLWEMEIKTNNVFVKNKLFEISLKLNYLIQKLEERRF